MLGSPPRPSKLGQDELTDSLINNHVFLLIDAGFLKDRNALTWEGHAELARREKYTFNEE